MQLKSSFYKFCVFRAISCCSVLFRAVPCCSVLFRVYLLRTFHTFKTMIKFGKLLLLFLFSLFVFFHLLLKGASNICSTFCLQQAKTMASSAPKRLQGLNTTIAEICAICGTPGLSYGVLHEGQVLHTDNFGHRDVEAQLPPTSDTQYYIGSLSKAFTAAAIGTLVEAGKTIWDTGVQDILGGGFHFSNPVLTEQNVCFGPAAFKTTVVWQ